MIVPVGYIAILPPKLECNAGAATVAMEQHNQCPYPDSGYPAAGYPQFGSNQLRARCKPACRASGIVTSGLSDRVAHRTRALNGK